MGKFKLTYFNGKGRAEAIRIVFAAAGQEYEDNRIEGSTWPDLKTKVPFGSLPCLEVDGKQIGQSITIVRYVGRELGLAGKDAWTQGLVDSVNDQITDIREERVKFAFEKDEEKKAAAQKEFVENKLQNILEKLEKFTKENKSGKGCLVGDSITYADCSFFAYLEAVVDTMGLKLDGKYPNLAAVYEAVKNNAGVAKYLKTRPETPF